MAFQQNYFAPMATGQSNTFSINYATQSAISNGAQNAFSYNGLAAGDDLSTIIASDYFLPVTGSLQLGDYIFISATDVNAVLYVSSINYADGAGQGASISVTDLSTSGTGTVTSVGTGGPLSGGPITTNGTITIEDNAIDYAYIQQANTVTLLGNPTSGTANVQEITLGTNLSFDGSVLNASGGGGSGTVTKVNTGGALTGGPFTTSGTVSLATNAVTYEYIQEASATTLLGNPTGSTANVEEITLGSGLSFSGTTLVSTGSGGTVTKVNTGGPLSGGPFTTSGTVSMANNALTYGYIQQASTATLLGNPTGGTANVEEITLGSGLSFSGTTLVSTGSGGTVTSITAGTGLSGGTITGSGTVSLSVPVAIANGGTDVTSVTTTPTATAFAGWDTNKNLSANNFIEGYATTATAAGTTVLTVSSAEQQYFTGTTTQTVTLPVTSTLVLGQSFTIVNNSTGNVTVQSSGANSIQVMGQSTTLIVTCISTSGTGASSWNAQYVSSGGSGTVTQVNTGGALSGGPFTTSGTVSLASNAVTYGYIQEASATTLLGNPTGSLANVEEITLGSTLAFTGTTLGLAPVLNAYTTVSLTAAQFKALSGTPISVFTAPGSGYMYYINYWFLEVIFGTTAYTSGSNFGMYYGSGTSAAASGVVTTAEITSVAASSGIWPPLIEISGTTRLGTAVNNAAVNMTVVGSNYASGDSTFVAHIWYSILPITI